MMTDEHTNDTPPGEQQAPNEGEIRSLGEDRYVISPEGSEGPNGGEGGPRGALPGSDSPGSGVDGLDGAYALALDARFGDAEDDLTVDTKDVSAAFEALLRWYAGNVADGRPPEAVIATLLANSGLDVFVRPSGPDDRSTDR